MENLNNIISENNVIGSPFGTKTQKIEDISEMDEKTSNKEQIVQNQFEKKITFGKVENPEEINRLTKEIFKK